MPTIDGLISGLDTTSLIEELLTFQRRPLEQLQARIKTETDRRTTLLSFTAQVLSLQSKADRLVKAASFKTPAVTSSNEDILLASGGEDLPAGSYSFRVKQLAQGAQYVSGGFTSADVLVGAGSLAIDAAGGAVDRPTELDLLNGGAGVRRGSIRITNRAGTSQVIDLSTSLTLQEVLEKINSASGLNVTAKVSGTGNARPGEAILLTDSSGGAGSLKVEEVSGGFAAKDLGLLGSVAAATLEGASIIKLGEGLALRALNDGLGVRTQTGADLSITQRNGTTFTVELTGKTTVRDVLDAINGAAGNTGVTVAISGRKLVATDASVGGTTFSIAEVGGGKSAADLGLNTAAAGGTITGSPVLADLDSVLLKTLHGGSGVAAGSIQITNRSGSAEVVDLSSATTLQEVIRKINTNAISVTASLNTTGDGLLLTDSSGGTGLFKVGEVSGGTTADDLGILNAVGVTSDQIDGSDLEAQYIGQNTLLSSLNGGQGVFAGKIRISDPSGRAFTVDLGQEETIGDVLKDINGAAAAAGSDLVASINSTGNGILLSAATGSGTLQVEEVDDGSTAHDLNLLGSAPAGTPRTLDGSFERSITVSAGDSLQTLADKINAQDLGLTASVLNDGSALSPFRLQLVSNRSGSAGGVIVRSSGGTDLDFTRAAPGRDAIIFYGGEGSQSVVIRSSTNEFEEVVRGLSLTAKDTSSSPIVVTARRDMDGVEEAIGELVDEYNEVMKQIRDLGRFDAATGSKGALFGENILRTVQRQISDAIVDPVLGLVSGSNLASKLGLRVSANGNLTFDSAKFAAAAAADPEIVRRIFTQSRKLDTGTRLEDFGNGEGIAASDTGPDLKINRRDGTSFDVSLAGDVTVRDLLASINNAAGNGGTVNAAISADGRSVVLTDTTSGSSDFSVDSQSGSGAASKLGLDSADSDGGDTITGREIELTGDPGVARRLFDRLTQLLDTEDGALELRAGRMQSEVDELNERTLQQEERVKAKEELLRRQFAQLEVVLGQNQNTLQRLTASLNGLARGA